MTASSALSARRVGKRSVLIVDDEQDMRFLLKAIECVKTGVGYPAFFNQRTYVRHESKTSGLPVEVTMVDRASIPGA